MNLGRELNEVGYAVLPNALSDAECDQVIGMYAAVDLFRSRIVMQRHNFGQGEYQYFTNPLPPLVASLRSTYYEKLAPVANEWARRLRSDEAYPEKLDGFLAACHAKGQQRPTPLILKYETGDYNRMHQDLYGDIAFPFQLAVCLSEPGRDFTGGEFLLAEQRPRVQTRVEVVPINKGDGVIFANRFRPVPGVKGYARLTLRHGVSRIRSGSRYCLGVIFHDAA